MKIASKIKNRDGSHRTVHIHGKPYVFKPYDDAEGKDHHVADVSDAAHAKIFLANDAFYAIDKKQERQPTLKRGDESTEPPAPKPSQFPQEVVAEAEKLLAGSATTIGTDISKVTSLDVVRAAIELETAGQNRKTVLNLLSSTVEYYRQAGNQV